MCTVPCACAAIPACMQLSVPYSIGFFEECACLYASVCLDVEFESTCLSG